MMKYVVVIPVVVLLISVFSTKAIAQQKESKKEMAVSFDIMDEIPRFAGCENISNEEAKNCFNEKMKEHIIKYFTYPEEAVKKNIQGNVIITFMIDKEGYVKDITAKGIGENTSLLEPEAKKIISLLPNFIPGKHNNKAVNVQYNFPLTYKLQ
ncbi:MAG: energy transducer TonB [Flavobacterium sp.]|nr:energy transducer TonB [Flavobacterium sp.]